MDGDSPPEPLQSKRDAIVFLPGIYRREGDTIDVVSRKIATALDQQAVTGKATFFTHEGEYEDYGSEFKTRVVTVGRKDGERETPLADIYEFDYGQWLQQPLTNAGTIRQATAIGRVLLANAHRLLGSLNRNSKDAVQKWQIFYGGLLFVALLAYTTLLIATALFTVVEAIPSGPISLREHSTSDVSNSIDSPGFEARPAPELGPGEASTGGIEQIQSSPLWLRIMQDSVIVLTALGLFGKFDLKRILARVSVELTTVVNYLNQGSREGILLGQFASLLEHIAEKEGNVEYESIHVVSYSFGSAIAMDALFPFNEASLGQRLKHVNCLVTIGCPFDFIRTYWPNYYTHRFALEESPKRWLNIYHNADVLASDFEDTGRGEPKMAGVSLAGNSLRRPHESKLFGRPKRLGQYTILEQLSLIGFEAHKNYWEKTQSEEQSCFNLVVAELYENSFALS